MDDFRSISPICGALRNLLLILSLVVVAGLRPLAAQAARTVSSNREERCLDAQRLEKAERSLDITGLMRQHHIPGMSVAVIHDFHVVCAKGYGVTAKAGSTLVTPATPFLAGSISKPVAAVGALFLVQQGKLSLDEDVNIKLASWKVPDNDHTQQRKVTLARLLSHTGGFTGGDFFPGYSAGKALPSLVQILNGVPCGEPNIGVGHDNHAVAMFSRKARPATCSVRTGRTV